MVKRTFGKTSSHLVLHAPAVVAMFFCIFTFQIEKVNAAPDCQGHHQNAPVCNPQDPCEGTNGNKPDYCNHPLPVDSGINGGSAPPPTPPQTDTRPPFSGGTLPPGAPDPGLGGLNEDSGREAIDNALELFSAADGTIANESLAEATAADGTGLDDSDGNSGGGTGASGGSVSVAGLGPEGGAGGAFGGGSDGNDGSGVGGLFGNEGENAGEDGANSEELAATAADKLAALNGSLEFDDKGPGAGQHGANGRSLAGYGSDSIDPDAAGGAKRLGFNGNGADDHLLRAGKLSLFEVINRRYEVWGSQNLR